jgi:pimeloyl-ACP methyl ester carboxylesterase
VHALLPPRFGQWPIPDHLEHRVQTPDGRILAVAEWGDSNGIPLISMHGTPGGRISYWTDPTIYARHGLRRLTFDRPGYGESTRHAGRIVKDDVADVLAIAAALNVDKFAVSGGSGGGPHALAAAALLPDRVLRALISVSIAPYDAEGLDFLAGQTAGNVAEFTAAQKGEAAIRPIATQERATTLERLAAGRADFFGDSYEVSNADKAQMAKHLERVSDHLGNALVHGADGWVDDDIAFTKPWGFDVSTITVPVYLTYGRTDNLVPRRTAIGWPRTSRTPRSTPTTMPATWATTRPSSTRWPGWRAALRWESAPSVLELGALLVAAVGAAGWRVASGYRRSWATSCWDWPIHRSRRVTSPTATNCSCWPTWASSCCSSKSVSRWTCGGCAASTARSSGPHRCRCSSRQPSRRRP